MASNEAGVAGVEPRERALAAYDKFIDKLSRNCLCTDAFANWRGTTADIKVWEKAKDELVAAHPDSEWWAENIRPDAPIDLWWLHRLLNRITVNWEISFEQLLNGARLLFLDLRLMEKYYMGGETEKGDAIADELQIIRDTLISFGAGACYYWQEEGDREWASRVEIQVGRWLLFVSREAYEVDGHPQFNCLLYDALPRSAPGVGFYPPESHMIYHWTVHEWMA